jgi:hypothetical protein
MLDRLGQTVTVSNQSADTDGNGDTVRDDHGNIVWATATTTDVSAEIVQRGEPAFARRADGVDTDVDALIFVKNSVTIRDGESDEALRATRIDASGESYVVRDVHDENNGLVRAHAAKED